MPGKRVQFDDDTWQAIQMFANRPAAPFKSYPLQTFAETMDDASFLPNAPMVVASVKLAPGRSPIADAGIDESTDQMG